MATETDTTTGLVSTKLPPFWRDDPILWFAQIESHFALAAISRDAVKFHTVVSALEQSTAKIVRDILISPPSRNKYETIKKALISRLSPSPETKLKRLLNVEEIGDRTPSEFLRHLRELGADAVSDTMMRTLWLSRLPSRMQDILVASANQNLDVLAEVADRINETTAIPPNVSSVDTSTTNPIQVQLDAVSQQLAALSASQSRTRSNRQRSPDRDDDDKELCWYHRTYGERAKRCRKPCKFLSKNSVGSLAAAEFYPSARRIYATDIKTRLQYLVDTGSDLCVFPRSKVQGPRRKTSSQLFAANGTVIATYGTIRLVLDLGLRRSFEWEFVIADVSQPIIGVDFLSFYDLLVDIRQRKLMTVPDQSSAGKPEDTKVVCGGSVFHVIPAEFPAITRPAGTRREVKHQTIHQIHTTPGQPTSCKPRRLTPDRLRIAEQKFDAMPQSGIARRSSNSWSAALHLVPKKEDQWRPCVDYHALNDRTIPDRHIQDFSQALAHKSVFSTIDLVRATGEVLSSSVPPPGLHRAVYDGHSAYSSQRKHDS